MSFSLRSLLLAFAVIGSALGAFGPAGLLAGACVVGVVAVLPGTKTFLSKLCILGGAAFCVACVWGLRPVDSAARAVPPDRGCVIHLKQIGYALHGYHEHYGSFPPAYVEGPDGRPWHSWRVLILPFLQGQGLYDAYHFDEPWDGPRNSELEPLHFIWNTCPRAKGRQPATATTTYFAVVGPETAWPGAKSMKLEQIADGAGETILLVEAVGLDIAWLGPRDLEFDKIANLSIPREKVLGRVAHAEGGGSVRVLMADGSVRWMEWGATGQLLPLLTANDGEKVTVPALAERRESRPFGWPNALAVVVMVVSTALLWHETSAARPSVAEGDHEAA